MKTAAPSLRRALLVAFLVTVGSIAPLPAGASDIDLGSPSTIDELLESPEYLPEHADVARLYQAFFNREPDIAGLVYWIDVYEDGAEMSDLAWQFSTSAEFRLTYGTGLSNAEFLTILYQNVLGRTYDQAGFDYWLGQMQGGLSRPDTVLWVVAGQEFITSYPFAPAFPDVSTALLQPGDVPSDYTYVEAQRSEATEAEILALTQCSQYRNLSSNEFQSFLGRPDGSAFVFQTVYAFSDEASAQAVIEDHRGLPSNCGHQMFQASDGAVVDVKHWAVRHNDLGHDWGDDSAVIKAEWVWSDGTSYRFYLYAVRNGNVVTVTDFTTRSLQTDYYKGAQYAGLTSDRMQALLSS